MRHVFAYTSRIWLLSGLMAFAGACFGQGTAILIIDDMGNGLALGERALQLPGKVNYSFLPHTPNARRLAEQAYRQGQEVLLHLPMSNLSDTPTGPGKLSPIMDRQQFRATLKSDLESVPHVTGVNNHMGSLLTQLHQPMQWLMDVLKQRQLFFVDSRTSPLSVAEETARDNHLPTLRRNVFLDDQLDATSIDRQIRRWMHLAKRDGIAVAIGHPHPQTLKALEQLLPTLQQQGIHLALLSEVLGPRLARNEASEPGSTHSEPLTAKN